MVANLLVLGARNWFTAQGGIECPTKPRTAGKFGLIVPFADALSDAHTLRGWSCGSCWARGTLSCRLAAAKFSYRAPGTSEGPNCNFRHAAYLTLPTLRLACQSLVLTHRAPCAGNSGRRAILTFGTSSTSGSRTIGDRSSAALVTAGLPLGTLILPCSALLALSATLILTGATLHARIARWCVGNSSSSAIGTLYIGSGTELTR
jgi:hypothetical protein